ncbi:MAG: hypothetical protein ACKV2V_04805, partial [Blastocatellia bacterium]
VAEGYRYPWQPAYQFRAPVALPAGTRIEVTAWLDNSEDNARLDENESKARKFAGPLCQVVMADAKKPTPPAGR